MATLHSLKVDKKLPATLIAELLLTEYDLTPISISEQIQGQIQNNTALGHNLELELSSGQLLKTETIEILLNRIFTENKSKDILLYSYPRTQSQLDSLRILLSNHDIGFGKIWHFKDVDTKEPSHEEIMANELISIAVHSKASLTKDILKELIKSCTNIGLA